MSLEDMRSALPTDFIYKNKIIEVPKQIITTEPLTDEIAVLGDAFLADIVDSLNLTYRTKTDYITERFSHSEPHAASNELARFTQEVHFGDLQELASVTISRDRERQVVRFAKYALLPDTIETIQAIAVFEGVEVQQ